MGAPILPDSMALDAAAQGLRHELHSLADAKNGYAEVEDARVAFRRAVGIDAGRATRQDQAAGCQLANAAPADTAMARVAKIATARYCEPTTADSGSSRTRRSTGRNAT